MFVGAEVGIVEHVVGIQYSHHANLVEVESLCHHLCSYQYIGSSSGEVADYSLVSIACTCGVEVHTGNMCLRECLTQCVLNALRATSLGA